MSEAGFTKGPWRFSNDDGQRSIRTPEDEAERFGCALMSDPTYYPWCPDSDADWHLIAAAPDMYEALEAVQMASREEIEFNAALLLVERALAKALGR